MHSWSREYWLGIHYYEHSCWTTATSSPWEDGAQSQAGNSLRHMRSETSCALLRLGSTLCCPCRPCPLLAGNWKVGSKRGCPQFKAGLGGTIGSPPCWVWSCDGPKTTALFLDCPIGGRLKPGNSLFWLIALTHRGTSRHVMIYNTNASVPDAQDYGYCCIQLRGRGKMIAPRMSFAGSHRMGALLLRLVVDVYLSKRQHLGLQQKA